MNARPIFLRLDRILGALKAKLSGASIGRGTRVSWRAELSVWEGGAIEIGSDCVIHGGAILATHPSGRIRIGDDCKINPYTIIYGHGGVWIGNSVRIAAHSVLIPANHKFDRPDLPISKQGQTTEGIRIEDDVWIGANVTILDGVTIPSGCVIAAGSVVAKPLTERGVYGGVPAKLIKRR